MVTLFFSISELYCKGCLCSYRQYLLKNLGNYCTYNDLSLKSQVILEYVREYDRQLCHREEIPLNISHIPLFFIHRRYFFT